MIVTSLFGSKVKIDQTKIIKQTKTIKENNSTEYAIHLVNGQTITLKEPSDRFEIETIDLKAKAKASDHFTPYNEPSLPKAPPTSNSTIMVLAKGKNNLSSDTYRGEMVWTHKTAPEIRISKSNGQIVKDVDISKMYKRR